MKTKANYELSDGTKIGGHFIEDPTMPDGQRFVATPHGWQKLTAWGHQNVTSCACGPHTGTEWHHIYGRGAGGSRRDDRPRVDGKPNLLWVCRPCHSKLTIFRRDKSAVISDPPAVAMPRVWSDYEKLPF